MAKSVKKAVKMTNKAGKTNPEQNKPGKLLKTVKKTQKGWSSNNQ